jgi:hypothetical protein
MFRRLTLYTKLLKMIHNGFHSRDRAEVSTYWIKFLQGKSASIGLALRVYTQPALTHAAASTENIAESGPDRLTSTCRRGKLQKRLSIIIGDFSTTIFTTTTKLVNL